MAQYRYTGPGPAEVPGKDGLTLVRPGDVWEFPDEPAFGPWEAAEKPADATDTESAQSPADDAKSAPAGESAPSSKDS